MEALLPKNLHTQFEQWLDQQGWSREDNKGKYEVLRMRKPGCVPVILFARKGSSLLSYNAPSTGTLVAEFKRAYNG